WVREVGGNIDDNKRSATVRSMADLPTRETVDVELRYDETEQMGVVHHPNYLVCFELARTALCRRTGFHYAEIEALGYLLMVSGAELASRRRARHGDRLGVHA